MAEVKRYLTPVFRGSFVHQVFKAESYEGGEPKYGLTAIWTPGKFSAKDKERWRTIMAALDDEAPAMKDKQSLYESAPVIPMPEARGGHSDYSKVLPQKEVQTAAKEPEGEPKVMTEDGGAAASEPAVDTGPEVTAAPTKRVTVKPAVGEP